MVNVKDFTKYIVPRVNENSRANGSNGIFSRTLCTTDLVSLPTYFEIEKQTNAARSLTDFALMNNANQNSLRKIVTLQGKLTGNYQSRTSGTSDEVLYLNSDHSIGWGPLDLPSVGLCPHLTLRLPEGVSSLEDIAREIGAVREVKLKNAPSYYTIDLGEYPKTKVGENGAIKLEVLYHGGQLREGLECTGWLFTTNGQRDFNGDFLSRQNPEFTYEGKKYVRVVVENQLMSNPSYYQDGTSVPEEGIQWAEVEPITFRIKNSQALLNGKARSLDLESDELILSGLPFYPNRDHSYSTMWQNSLQRAFLNSADSRELDGNPEYEAPLKWDFRKSGWLHQALDLTRAATKVYTVPASETRIVAYAFAGCVGLERIIIPKHVTEIDEHAFDGCVHTQLQITPNSNLAIDQNAFAGSAFQYTYIAKDGKVIVLSPCADAKLETEYFKTKFDPKTLAAYLYHCQPKLTTLNMNTSADALRARSREDNLVNQAEREI